MRNLLGSRVLVAGIAGIVVGSAVEALVNHLVGRAVIADGMMWGAALAILIASLPNFVQMGSLTVKSDKPAVNLVVGIGMFVLISVLIVTIFFGLLWVIGRMLP